MSKKTTSILLVTSGLANCNSPNAKTVVWFLVVAVDTGDDPKHGVWLIPVLLMEIIFRLQHGAASA